MTKYCYENSRSGQHSDRRTKSYSKFVLLFLSNRIFCFCLMQCNPAQNSNPNVYFKFLFYTQYNFYDVKAHSPRITKPVKFHSKILNFNLTTQISSYWIYLLKEILFYYWYLLNLYFFLMHWKINRSTKKQNKTKQIVPK